MVSGHDRRPWSSAYRMGRLIPIEIKPSCAKLNKFSHEARALTGLDAGQRGWLRWGFSIS